MSNDRSAWLGQQFPKGLCLLDVNRIDDRQPVTGSDLDQAKLWTVAVFGNKFRVETNHRAVGDLVTELLQLVDRIYGLVSQGYAYVSDVDCLVEKQDFNDAVASRLSMSELRIFSTANSPSL